jgi:hypothetical protein
MTAIVQSWLIGETVRSAAFTPLGAAKSRVVAKSHLLENWDVEAP